MHRAFRGWGFAIVVFSSAWGRAACAGEIAGPHYRPDVDAFISGKMADAHVLGLSACIIEQGRVTWAAGYGDADRGLGTSATARTGFSLASVAKVIAAVAIMQLYEEGAFDLDDDVSPYLDFPVRNPDYPDTPISFRMLLTHTSSIRDDWSILDANYCDGDSPIALGEYMEGYLVPGGDYNTPNCWASRLPGTRYAYSNIGFGLVGHLVEALSGDDFDTWCNEKIFDPLGMDRTRWFLRDLDPAQLAMPYRYNRLTRRYTAAGHYGYPDYPSGQLRAPVLDLAHLFIAVMGDGTWQGVRILDEATLSEMKRVQFPEIEPTQGLCFYTKTDGGQTYIGHDGGDVGVATEMFHRPSDDTGVILLGNGEAFFPREYQAFLDIERRLFDEAEQGGRGRIAASTATRQGP